MHSEVTEERYKYKSACIFYSGCKQPHLLRIVFTGMKLVSVSMRVYMHFFRIDKLILPTHKVWCSTDKDTDSHVLLFFILPRCARVRLSNRQSVANPPHVLANLRGTGRKICASITGMISSSPLMETGFFPSLSTSFGSVQGVRR